MEQLAHLLSQFQGKTPDQIAEMVKRRGIKGRMGTTYGCPMALLLDGVGTGRYIIGRKYIVRHSGKVIEKSRTPENIAAFVRKFDIGGYPSLIAPPPRCMAKIGERPGNRHKDKSVGGNKRGTIKNHITKLVSRFA